MHLGNHILVADRYRRTAQHAKRHVRNGAMLRDVDGFTVSRLRGRNRRPSRVDTVRKDAHMADRRHEERGSKAEHIRHMTGQRRDHGTADYRDRDDAGGRGGARAKTFGRQRKDGRKHGRYEPMKRPTIAPPQ